jgi:non-ribosomal peptide synthetase component F
MHHIISDVWSIGIIIRELTDLYSAFSQGKPSPLAELPIQYADYALWQREWLQGEELERQLNYWRRQLADAPAVLELPTDKPRPPVQSYRGAKLRIEIDPELTRALKELSRQEGGTLFMTLLAAFKVLLSRYCQQTEICIGISVANRSRAETASVIGFFVNTLVLRTDLSGDPEFRQLLGRVREVALGAFAHQDLPFEKLVEELQPERSLSYAPLFQVMMALQNTPRESLSLAGLEVTQLELENSAAKFDLSLILAEENEQLRGDLEYNTDLFEAATIERWRGHYRRLLEAIVADPAERISRLPLLTETERERLLVEWNRTQFDFPETARCLREMIDAESELLTKLNLLSENEVESILAADEMWDERL